MNLTCIAVDDEPASLHYISKCISQNALLKLTYSTTDPYQAKHYIENHKTDLLISDLSMPGMSGLALKASVKGKCKTIFITGHTNFALEAMGENAVSLLLKPFSLVQFNDAVLKAVKIIAFDKQKESVDGLKQKFNKLTDAEKKVILALPKAKGMADIAAVLNISTKTVARHKENIKDKLAFTNNHELIIFAYELSKINV